MNEQINLITLAVAFSPVIIRGFFALKAEQRNANRVAVSGCRGGASFRFSKMSSTDHQCGNESQDYQHYSSAFHSFLLFRILSTVNSGLLNVAPPAPHQSPESSRRRTECWCARNE